MNIPKVIFKKISLKENIEIIKWTLNDKNSKFDLSNKTLKLIPGVTNLNVNTKVKEILKLNNKNIKESCKKYQLLWNDYNDEYMMKLSEYFNIKWPSNYKKITGIIGVMPIFPRFLKEKCFALSSNINEEDLIDITAHECLHFIYFEKWKSLYPSCDEKEFDSPYLIWELSEMVVDIILNNNLFNDIFNHKFKSYEYFYKDNKAEMSMIKKIYNDNCIEDAIKKSYEYLLNKRNLL